MGNIEINEKEGLSMLGLKFPKKLDINEQIYYVAKKISKEPRYLKSSRCFLLNWLLTQSLRLA